MYQDAQLHQSRFTVLPSPAEAALSPAMYIDRQPGHQRPRTEEHEPSHNRRYILLTALNYIRGRLAAAGIQHTTQYGIQACPCT